MRSLQIHIHFPSPVTMEHWMAVVKPKRKCRGVGSAAKVLTVSEIKEFHRKLFIVLDKKLGKKS